MCPIADSVTTLLGSFSVKTMMAICGLNSPTTKKFLSKLLSDFYRRLFPLAPLSSNGPKYQFSDSTQTELGNCPMKHRCNSVV